MHLTRGHSHFGGGVAGAGTDFGSATRTSISMGVRGGQFGRGGAGPPHLSEHAFFAL
jgi:hypothetical protein